MLQTIGCKRSYLCAESNFHLFEQPGADGIMALQAPGYRYEGKSGLSEPALCAKRLISLNGWVTEWYVACARRLGRVALVRIVVKVG